MGISNKLKKILLVTVIFWSINSFSQVIVNGHDLNKEVDVFELWAFKKVFSMKESLYINYGQKKFRPNYYDHKTQRVIGKNGYYFRKGDYLKLYKYLKTQGWQKMDERGENIGDLPGRVIIFEKVNNEN